MYPVKYRPNSAVPFRINENHQSPPQELPPTPPISQKNEVKVVRLLRVIINSVAITPVSLSKLYPFHVISGIAVGVNCKKHRILIFIYSTVWLFHPNEISYLPKDQ